MRPRSPLDFETGRSAPRELGSEPSPPQSPRPCRGFAGSVAGQDIDDPASTPGAELHVAGDQRKQGVVAATTDAGAGVEVRAALADDDLAGVDQLAAVPLHAEALGVGVPTVLGRGRTLLVCHEFSPSREESASRLRA